MYGKIFFTNMIRLQKERGMNNIELGKLAGVSPSYLSELSRGGAGRTAANPSIEKMEAIAAALEVPLLEMLIPADDIFRKQLAISLPENLPKLPRGYERVIAILPEYRAYQVRQWDREARKKLKKSQ